MKSSHLWILALGLLTAIAVVMAAFLAGGPEKSPASTSAEPERISAGAHGLPTAKNGVSGQKQSEPPPEAQSMVAPAVSVVPANAPAETIREAIHEIAISYDPKELPKIQPFLLHPDPAIRAAALDGMLVLGDAAAAPLLRAAAKQVVAPQEAVKMVEAADYLELPSGSLLPAKKTKTPPSPPPVTSK